MEKRSKMFRMSYCPCLILFFLITVSNLSIGAQDSTGSESLMATGTLVAIHDNSIALKNDKKTFVVHVNSGTSIWRGGTARLRDLHLGDNIDVVYHMERGEMVAAEISANIDNWSGTITRVGPHTIAILREDEQGNALGPAIVVIDDHTESYDPKEIKVGGSLQVVGLILGNHRIRATRVLTVLPPQS